MLDGARVAIAVHSMQQAASMETTTARSGARLVPPGRTGVDIL